MAYLPSQHPTLSIHLSDNALTPLITSSSSPSHFDSLTSLTSSALSSQTAAQKAHLGRPQRIMVEYPDSGAVVLQTYIDPRDSLSPTSPGKDAHDEDVVDPRRNPPSEDAAPMLVGVVVAGSSAEAREAKQAAARLETFGRQFQREWMVHVEQGTLPSGD